MGWFDGASEVASSYVLDGYGGGDRRASPSRSSRHGGSTSGHKKHKSHKSHKTETGSAFGDWAAGVSGGGAPRHGASKSTTSFFSVGGELLSSSFLGGEYERGWGLMN